MARKRRTRKYYRRKGKWSANINNIKQNITLLGNSTTFASVLLQQNPVQNSNSVSQQYTVKNVEMTYELETTDGVAVIENLQAYIMYVPQSMTIDENLPFTHPEYIMAYRWLGSPNNDSQQPGRNSLFIKTRLSRRLQTGDSIIFLLIGENSSSAQQPLNIRGLVRYWTKAN